MMHTSRLTLIVLETNTNEKVQYLSIPHYGLTLYVTQKVSKIY